MLTDLDGSYSMTASFKNDPNAARRDTFPETTDDPTRDKYVLHLLPDKLYRCTLSQSIQWCFCEQALTALCSQAVT